MKRIAQLVLIWMLGFQCLVLPAMPQQATVTVTTVRTSFLTGRVAEYRFNEGSGQQVFNRVHSAATPSVNLLGLPEQSFGTFSGFVSVAWEVEGGAVTEGFAANPVDGAMTATRYLASAGSVHQIAQQLAVPAGTYTFSLWAKSNTGVTQNVRLGIDFTLSPDTPVTTSWSRLTFTATTSGTSTQVYFPTSDAAKDATDIIIYGPQVEVGGSATAYVPANFDGQLGSTRSVDTHDPSWVSTGIDTSAGGYISAVNNSAVSLTNITVYAVVKWPSGGGTPSETPIINEHYSSSRLILSGSLFNDVLVFSYSGSVTPVQEGQVHDGNWHVIVGQYDGTTERVFIDNMEVGSVPVTLSSVNLQQLFIGNTNGFTPWPGQIAYAAICNQAHSTSQIMLNEAHIASDMAARGITIDNTATSRFYVAEGDSITDFVNYGRNGYFFLAARGVAQIVSGRDFAVSGSQIQGGIVVSNMVDRAAAVDALYNPNRKANILSILIGRNDLGVGTIPTTFVANLKAYCLARKAVGWKIVLLTVLPSTVSGFNAVRNTANGLIRGDSSYYDVLADVATDTTIGCDSCAANTTYYADGTHPTNAGEALIAPYVITAIQSIY